MLRTARPRAGARRRVGLILLLSGLGLAGCGGAGGPAKPAAERVCQGATAVASELYGYRVRPRILSRDPANIVCLLTGQPERLRVRIVTQSSDQAYMEFDTETSHQSQVYGPGIHEPGQIPQGITVPGAVVAVWIPAAREVVATNAQLNRGGTYVTVTVSGPTRSLALSLARMVTRATFGAHLRSS